LFLVDPLPPDPPRSGARELGARAALALFCGALALRALHLAEIAGTPLERTLLGDAVAYDAWARRIAAGDLLGGEVFYQSPVYPYFLGAVYALLGPDPLLARCVQAVLGSLACVLAARAAAGFLGRRAGWIAGALVAVHPAAIFYDGEIQKASLSLLLAAALLASLPRLRDRPTAGLAVAGGALAGLFGLHRENALLLLPAIAVWLARPAAGPARRRSASAGAFLAGAALVLTPVALRNLAVGGELVLTTSQAGPNFYIGNHAGADGRYRPLRSGRGSARFEREDARELAEAALGRPLGAREVSRYWLARGLELARRDPGRWLALLARKAGLTWSRTEIVDTVALEAVADTSRPLRWLEPFANFGVLAPLAAAGAFWTRRRWRELTALYLWLGVWTASVAAFFVLARYRLPLVPVLAIFAGAAVAYGIELARGRSWRALAAGLALALGVGVAARLGADGRDPRGVTWASLGNALADQGRSREGERWLEAAVAASPRFTEAHLSLGHLRLAREDLDAAAAAYRRVLEIEPERAEAWNNLGVIASRQGRGAEALASFRRAAAADPDYPSARYNLARALAANGDLAAARAELERFLRLSPGDPEAARLLAELDAALGRARS
jgi:tetratricopeptide (TPR) repeat protein